MQQQILCQCATHGDLLFFKCPQGHQGLLCGQCLRSGSIRECPECFSLLTVGVPEARRPSIAFAN